MRETDELFPKGIKANKKENRKDSRRVAVPQDPAIGREPKVPPRRRLDDETDGACRAQAGTKSCDPV
jgi:hypothetical protein